MDHSSKIKILTQLARTSGEMTENAVKKEAAKVAAKFEHESHYDVLEQQIELLDTFAYRLPETVVGIVRSFLKRLDELELTHEPELARYQNKNHLIIEILKLLSRIRYHRLEDILEIFMNYTKHEDSAVCTQAMQGLEHLAEFNIDIYFSGKNRAGLGGAPQLKILAWLEALDLVEQQRNLSDIITLCKHLLSSSMRGTAWDYKSVVLSTTSVPANDEIKDIRWRCLHLLRRLYGTATTTAEKTSIINSMLDSTRTPNSGTYGDELLRMVSDNTLYVMTFFKELLPGENLQIIQKVEHDAFWRYRHAPGDDVKAAALEIRDVLASHDEYKIYKDLIGFEGVFEEWEESLTKEPDFMGIDEYRSAKSKEYAESINIENWPEWRDRILKFVNTESDDLATFPNFFNFLQQFAERSPDLAFSLLTKNLDEIELFTIPLLKGLWKGPLKSDLRALMLEWIATDQQLIAVTKLFISNENLDKEFLQILLDKGAKDANRDILTLIVEVAVSNYADGGKDLIPEFFLPAVESLTRIGFSDWINVLWYRKERGEILHHLGKEGREIVLSGLLLVKDIEYHAEELLIPLAKDDPQRIITLFGERLQYEKAAKPGGNYDAIPFQFHELNKVLADSPEIAVDTVRLWFDENREREPFQYHGANLLKIIFPNFSEQFEAKLLDLVHAGEKQDIEFVLSVLRNYEGEPFLHGICRAIVAKLPEKDELLTTVEIVLESTGVVMGEFGFAQTYVRKMEEIKPWLSDENELVRNFASSYVKALEERSEYERLRAEESLALRKHTYGVREEKVGDEDGAREQKETAKADGKKEK